MLSVSGYYKPGERRVSVVGTDHLLIKGWEFDPYLIYGAVLKF